MKLQKPSWYKKLQASNWAVLICLGAIIIVATYKLFNLVVPHVHDINVYLWAKAYHELFVSGVWFPQWLPQMWYGFGLPVFYYYNPLFYWITEIGQIIGLGTIATIKTILVGTVAMGGFFTYLWAKEYVNKLSAVLAASLFILAPYFLSLIYLRGAYPEAFALSLIPLLMWLTIKLFKEPKKIFYPVGIAVVLSAIILTHSLTAIIAGFLYIVYALYLYTYEFRNGQILKNAALTGIFALALTAFYWFPVFANLDYANMSVLTENKFFFGGNFPELKNIFNLSLIYKQGWLTLGIIPAAILISGWLSQHEILSIQRQRWQLFFLILASVFVFLVLPYSDFLWSWIPGIAIFQFPARFLGPAILMLAIVGGMMLDQLADNVKIQKATALVVLVLAIGLALPFIQSTQYKTVPDINTNDDLNVYTYVAKSTATTTEFQSGSVDRGIAAFEYLPQQLDEGEALTMFQKTSGLFADPDDITKIDPPTKLIVESGDVQISTVKDDYYDMEFLLRVLEPSRIRINQFEFPAWKISLNDQPAEVEIIIDEPGQFLDIPTGNHTLKMKLVTLPNVFWSRVFSGIILLVSVVWLIWFKLNANTAKLKRYGKANEKKKSR